MEAVGSASANARRRCHGRPTATSAASPRRLPAPRAQSGQARDPAVLRAPHDDEQDGDERGEDGGEGCDRDERT